MGIVCEFTWPLILALISGIIIGIVFTLAFKQKIKILQKTLLFLVVGFSLIGGVVFAFALTWYGEKLSKQLFSREVEVVKNIDLEKDYFFAPKKSNIKGVVQEGSIATQTFSKGQASYLMFGTVVDRSYIKEVKKK